ncbi:uncharacterized protein LOC133529373 [Cydia pomonella]|uniref:uncharacterized protein LOC133529373 n=1 Tax=Cydia pomonella TaxID=82600 RepID=UPI002ADE1D16|nr:uncharacterized protein LOC133529373 [Cydia pomonella]
MEEEDTKQCPNCKREIPSINFTTHSVHCARNLRNCPVCKEPVPVAQLQEHHDALHKEVPCKKCGESVCGTDLEDHIRDSCAQTIKPCRYCELELPRHALPPHETYCGARSEQCPECKEYVMIKYRQLHLDSNHGFIRLSDDPVPIEIKAKPKPITNGFAAPSTSRQNEPNRARPQTEIPQTGPTRSDLRSNGPQTDIRYFPGSSQGTRGSAVNGVNGAASDYSRNDRVNIDRVSNMGTSGDRNGKVTVKRTNDQPQINTSVEPREKVHKELPSRGAVKKRPAPPPPAPPAPPADPTRDLPYWSAQKRAQEEERKRQEQTAYNLSVGLPPVLSPAAKLDKLRKMDALHNREVEEDYSHKLRGRVQQPTEPEGYRLGDPDRVGQNGQIDDLSHLRPMTAQQFMDRFQELQLGQERRLAPNGAAPPGGSGPALGGAGMGPGCAGMDPGRAGTGPGRAGPAAGRSAVAGDRFSEIKSSLRELRRGLNEVTAPYNTTLNATNNTNIDSNRLCPPSPPAGADDADELRLPCEFCGVPILADDLVLHQTGCRPDLTQYRPKSSSRSRSPRAPRPRPHPRPRPRPGPEADDPVIPCEFCTESLPVYLISEHQERCRREANVLYPD